MYYYKQEIIQLYIYIYFLASRLYFTMIFGFYQMRLMCGAVATITICIYAIYTVNIDWLTQLLLGYLGCNYKVIFVEKISIIYTVLVLTYCCLCSYINIDLLVVYVFINLAVRGRIARVTVVCQCVCVCVSVTQARQMTFNCFNSANTPLVATKLK